MTGKIFRNFVLVGLSVLLVSAGLFLWALYGSYEQQLSTVLMQQTYLVAHGVEQAGQEYLTSMTTDNRMTWIGPDGSVWYDNQVQPEQMDNHGEREEVRMAKENGAGESVRYSDTLAEKTIYAAVRLSDGSVIRLADSRRTVVALLAKLFQPMLLILGAAVVLSLMLASRLSKRLVTPILELDLEHPEQCRTYDELTPLLTRIRKQNETIHSQMQELRRQQEEFNTLTEEISEGIILLDRKGQVLSCNSAALRLLGTTSLVKGASALELERSQVFRRAVEELLAGQRSQQELRRGGQCIQLLSDPVMRDGRMDGGVMVLLDVTEREQSERLRREFTANVSHELKTPLTSISGMAEIIQSGIVRPEDIPEFAGDIHRESSRLIALVEDIIHLSQLDEGGQMPERSQVDLLQVSQTVARRLRRQAEQAQVTIRVEGGPLLVEGVPAVLEEIVYNLCDNGVKYNRPGGQVTVTVDEDRRLLRVEDTGIGIPPQDQQRVFERFYRVDKSRSREIGGTGLGLSIVKHGAALHDAAIELTSVPGQGTAISLTFPGKTK